MNGQIRFIFIFIFGTNELIMRNVMVRCIFSALSVGFCLIGALGQEFHRYQWSDQQVLADEWKPFVPDFTQRQFEAYSSRPETSRQFFGKNVDAVQNPFKKSFQTTAPANNLDPYAVPPILGSFNTLSLQTIQARNPLLEKNIKDNQFLDQSPHLHQKFYPQNNQQPQRFPSAFIPPPAPPQYIPQHHHHQHQQHQHQQHQQHQQQQYPNQFRIENPIKPQLLQSPSRTIQTSVQIFPPNPPNHFQNNAYFLGAPQKEENYEDDSLSRKQAAPRPNDFLLNNNVATIYGTRDPALNIPPPALKPTPFLRNEPLQDHFLYDNANLKSIQRYEGVNTFNKRPFSEPQGIPNKKQQEDNPNPSKQVYEQLSHFGRPFSLPKEPINEYNRKPEQHKEIETNQAYAPEIYKKEKIKANQSPQKTPFVRIPPNTIYHDVSTPSNLQVDYEPGKLQSIKTVTYVPQREVIQFNEEDISSGQQYPTSEKYNTFTKAPFLPTPTESEESLGSFNPNFQRFTTPAQKPTTGLPKNHKYSSIQHSGNRNRYQQNTVNQDSNYYTSTEAEQPFEEKIRYSSTTQQNEIENQPEYQETTTRKSGSRRRKPSKANKNKENRNKTPAYADFPAQNTLSNENYPFVANEISTTEATIQYTTKKKPTKFVQTEDDYPNYPQYVKQSENYPKEFFQNSHPQTIYQEPVNEYFNSEKQEEKENYPQTLTPISTTTTTTTEPPTTSIKARIKNKYNNTTRPRFSIKDYNKRTTTASTPISTSTTEIIEESLKTENKPIRKFNFASRPKNKTETTKPEEETTSETIRKYKPRPRPSKYRSTTTTLAPDTTTERVNTFKPSTSNRYKSSTSKYYNRFRTTTEITSNDAEEPSPSSSDKKPVRTMLFSAKRSSLLRGKSTTTPKIEYIDDDEQLEDEEELTSSSSLKKAINQYKASKLDKADDAAQTNLMTSSEEQNEKKELKEAAKKNIKESSDSEEEVDDFSDILELKENEVTTPSSSVSAHAEDRMDDADKVSKVSSLTSIDESDIPISFFQKWSSNDNQNK